MNASRRPYSFWILDPNPVAHIYLNPETTKKTGSATLLGIHWMFQIEKEDTNYKKLILAR